MKLCKASLKHMSQLHEQGNGTDFGLTNFRLTLCVPRCTDIAATCLISPLPKYERYVHNCSPHLYLGPRCSVTCQHAFSYMDHEAERKKRQPLGRKRHCCYECYLPDPKCPSTPTEGIYPDPESRFPIQKPKTPCIMVLWTLTVILTMEKAFERQAAATKLCKPMPGPRRAAAPDHLKSASHASNCCTTYLLEGAEGKSLTSKR